MPHLKNLLSSKSLEVLDHGLKRKATEMKIKSLKKPADRRLKGEAEKWDDLASR